MGSPPPGFSVPSATDRLLIVAGERRPSKGSTTVGVALVVIGFLALLAAVVVGVVALIRRVRSRPARRVGFTAGGLAVGGLVLMIGGGAAIAPAVAPSSSDQAADTAAAAASSTTAAAATLTATPTAPASTTSPTATPVLTAAPVVTSSPVVTREAVPASTLPAPSIAPSTAPGRSRVRSAAPVRRAAGPAAAAVAALAVKGRAPKTGYSREAFGPAWADVDANGCDTRNDVLRRDLIAIRTVADSRGCEVATGTLHDPYSGTTITFTRGASTSTAVQIDHVVALSDAWQTGAFAWTPTKREAFANDPLNLLAVNGSLNESKGDGDAATWLPPDKAERCAYVARQVAVKTAYSLWDTPAEAAATTRILTSCPGQTLPTEAGTTPPRIDPAAPVAAPTAKAPATPTAKAPTASPRPRRTSPPPALPRPRPTATPVAPGGGATALCRDGSYSYAAHHQGACSHHGGVEQFYK